MALSRQYLLFVWLFCYNLEIPDLHCTTIFLNYLLILNCTDTNNHPPPLLPDPPPHPICPSVTLLIYYYQLESHLFPYIVIYVIG